MLSSRNHMYNDIILIFKLEVLEYIYILETIFFLTLV